MSARVWAITAAAGLALAPLPALADYPVLDCRADAPGMVTCTAGFSNGAGAAGRTLEVLAPDGALLVRGTLDPRSSFTFSRPAGAFTVLFDAGPGHTAEVEHEAIP